MAATGVRKERSIGFQSLQVDCAEQTIGDARNITMNRTCLAICSSLVIAYCSLS